MKRTAKVCLLCAEVAANAMAIAAIAIIGFLWAVLSGPISLDVIKPNIEKAMERSAPPGTDAEIGELALRLDRARQSVALFADDARLLDANGVAIASAPEIRLELSVLGLVRGMAAVREIDIASPQIILTRAEDGVYALSPEAAAERVGAPGESTGGAPPVWDNLYGDEYLNRVSMTNGVIVLHDVDSGRTVRIEEAAFSYTRDADNAAFEADAVCVINGKTGSLSLEGLYSGFSRTFYAETVFEDAPVAEFIAFAAPASPLRALQADATGRASVNLGSGGDVLAADIDIALGEGTAALSVIGAGDDIPLAGAHLKAQFDPATDEIRIEDFGYDAAGNKASASGALLVTPSADGAATPAEIGFDIAARDITLSAPGVLPRAIAGADLDARGVLGLQTPALALEAFSLSVYEAVFSGALHIKEGRRDGAVTSPAIKADIAMTGAVNPEEILSFWPVGFVLGARDWIEANVWEGRISNVAFTMDVAEGDIADNDGVPDEKMRLGFAFENGVADYVPGLTPLTRLKGTGVLTGNTFVLRAEDGRVGDIRLTDGEVMMPRLVPKGAVSRFSGLADGKTADILGLLDMKPFEFAKGFGVDPADLGGDARVRFELSRPNRRHVTIDKIGYAASAAIKDFSLPDLVGDTGLEQADLTLSLNKEGIVASGEGRLGDVAVDLTWTEKFFTDDLSTTLEIAGNLDSAERDAFGIFTRSFLNGPIGFSAKTRGEGTNVREAMIEADFTNTEINLDRIGWVKEALDRATARLQVNFLDDGGLAIKDFEMLGDGVSIKGAGELGASGRLISARLDRFDVRDLADLTLTAVRGKTTDALEVRVAGPMFNAGPIVQDVMSPAGGSLDWGAGLLLTADIESLGLQKGVRLADAEVVFQHDGTAIRDIDFYGQFADGATAQVRLADSAKEGVEREFKVLSDDAGAVLRGIFGIESVYGGNLDLHADIRPQEGAVDAPSVDGGLEINQFRVIDAPFLARLLAAASLTGLVDVLSGEGIAFSRLKSGFTFDDGELDIADASAVGPSMGLTMSGPAHLDENTIKVNGAIAPAYAINSAFGALPIVGNVLVSREGEGLFALSYNLNGELDEPTIFVNPLSALTPGALRRIFEPAPNPRFAAPVEEQHAAPTPESLEAAPAPADEPL